VHCQERLAARRLHEILTRAEIQQRVGRKRGEEGEGEYERADHVQRSPVDPIDAEGNAEDLAGSAALLQRA